MIIRKIRPLAAMMSLALASSAHAGEIDLGLYSGVVVPGGNHELYSPTEALYKALNPGPVLGARLSYRPLDLVAGEVEAYGAAASSPGAGGAAVYAYRGQVLVFPPLELPADLETFLVAGMGNIGVNSSNDVLGSDLDWAAHVGLGGRLPITEQWGVRLDLRYLIADPNTALSTPGGHTEVLVGVNYHLAAPEDSDADGIADSMDACSNEPETLNGYKDDDGCPDVLARVVLRVVDTDGVPAEGVTIYVDGVEAGRTDVDGRVVLEDHMPGTTLAVRGEHFHMSEPVQSELSLAEGDNEGNLTATWLPGRVRVVTKANGAAVDVARVAFNGPQELAAAPVENGDHLFFLSPGDWTVLVTAPTWGSELVDLSIAPDETSMIVIEMALEPAKVKVTLEEVEILQQVLFELGSADLQPQSLELLNEVAATILANPRITKIQIQGHTDSQGPASSNRRLSQARVESVMHWMVDHGVGEDRLEARGFGEDDPIAPNNTDEGRALNRRVVFSILEQLTVEE